MAALDFPASPSNGDTFGNWIYNSSKLAWQSKPLTPAKTVNSPTAPTSPADGDQWFNTNTGQLFIYYVDVNGGQWIESRAPITADGYVSPNYVINGAMEINQRGLTSTGVTTQQYTLDRWLFAPNGGTVTQSYQTFTPGAGPISTIEPTGFLRTVTTGQSGVNDYTILNNNIENVRELAGKTVTVSFYAKASANGVQMSHEFSQNYGTGGSPSAAVDVPIPSGGTSKFTLTTSWARYSYTMALPSLSGKTLGTTPNTSYTVSRFWLSAGSGATPRTSSLGVQNATIDLWGLQIEEGTIATPFRRNANSIQGELAACHRYFFNVYSTTSDIQRPVQRFSTTGALMTVTLPVPMRANPVVTSSNSGRMVFYGTDFGVSTASVSALALNSAGVVPNEIEILITHSSIPGTGVHNSFDTFGISNPFLFLSAEF